MISARPLRGVDFPTDGAGNMHPALCNNEGEIHSDLQDHLDLVVSAPSETWRLCGNSSGVQGWMVMTENLVRAVRPAAGQAHDAHQADCDPERELLGGRLTLALNETSTGLCFSSPPLAEGLNHKFTTKIVEQTFTSHLDHEEAGAQAMMRQNPGENPQATRLRTITNLQRLSQKKPCGVKRRHRDKKSHPSFSSRSPKKLPLSRSVGRQHYI
jgi:hypothetical protein